MKITQWIYNKAQIVRRSERNFVRGLKDPNDGLFPLRVAGMISLRFDFPHPPHFISLSFFFAELASAIPSEIFPAFFAI